MEEFPNRKRWLVSRPQSQRIYLSDCLAPYLFFPSSTALIRRHSFQESWREARGNGNSLSFSDSPSGITVGILFSPSLAITSNHVSSVGEATSTRVSLSRPKSEFLSSCCSWNWHLEKINSSAIKSSWRKPKSGEW